VNAAYGAVRVIEDVSLNVNAGETVVLLGTNGNGKSTLMKCVMGIVRPSTGRIVAEIDGEKFDLVGRTTEQIVDLGIALVPEGRRLFPKQPRLLLRRLSAARGKKEPARRLHERR
jgi:branched-chain amino acid transport system ATP-binding protein